MTGPKKSVGLGERRGFFRGRSHPGKRVDLYYRRVDGAATASGEMTSQLVSGDLGVGGAFLITSHPEAIATRLVIRLELPDGGSLPLEGEVRWTRPPSSHTAGGMGVAFDRLDPDSLLALRNYFAGLL